VELLEQICCIIYSKNLQQMGGAQCQQ
jgi:hypothetical protein